MQHFFRPNTSNRLRNVEESLINQLAHSILTVSQIADELGFTGFQSVYPVPRTPAYF